MAVRGGNLEALKLLWHLTECRNDVALLGVESKNLSVIKYLIDDLEIEFDEADESPLTLAYGLDCTDIVEYLISVLPEDSWYTTDDDGNNILQVAAIEEDLPLTTFLLERGFSPNEFLDSATCSALSWAILRENMDMIKALLSAGAYVNEAIDPKIFDSPVSATNLFELAEEVAPNAVILLQSRGL
jgi:ankyrin repeat protein